VSSTLRSTSSAVEEGANRDAPALLSSSVRFAAIPAGRVVYRNADALMLAIRSFARRQLAGHTKARQSADHSDQIFPETTHQLCSLSSAYESLPDQIGEYQYWRLSTEALSSVYQVIPRAVHLRQRG
jgi:hypothetical protein